MFLPFRERKQSVREAKLITEVSSSDAENLGWIRLPAQAHASRRARAAREAVSREISHIIIRSVSELVGFVVCREKLSSRNEHFAARADGEILNVEHLAFPFHVELITGAYGCFKGKFISCLACIIEI